MESPRDVHESPSSIGDQTTVAGNRHLIDPLSAVLEDAHTRRENDNALLARLVADVLKDSVAELRRDNETRMSQITTAFQGEISALREGEENRLARLEEEIATLKPAKIETDPSANFWTVYKKVADERGNDLVSNYIGDLDTSLFFAGLFSAIILAFIVQIVPQLQPNALLLRILEQNASFCGIDPLAPIPTIPTGVVRAQSILFASLSVTSFVIFVAVLAKQWILYHTRVTTWGNTVNRERERQAKLVGLQKWGMRLIVKSLPIMLLFAFLLFGIACAVCLWDLNVSVMEAAFVVIPAPTR